MKRTAYLERIDKAFKLHKVVALLGPRQCGKTTLAHDFIAKHSPSFPKKNFFDLEKNSDLARLANPQLALESLEGLVVIDEIQRISELFPTLRTMVDYTTQRYLILGSASRDLLRQSSETLAGRFSILK